MSNYIYTNGQLCKTNELTHYGVLGMKWGVRRAINKSNSKYQLQKEALNYDKKAAKYSLKAVKAAKRSGKVTAEHDYTAAYKQNVKAAKYSKKASKAELKFLKSDDDLKSSYYHRKSEKMKYKSEKAKRKANLLANPEGYSDKALKWSIKSDEVTAKAAKVRYKIANNDYYIEKMKRKVSSIPKEDLNDKYAFVKKLNDL